MIRAKFGTDQMPPELLAAGRPAARAWLRDHEIAIRSAMEQAALRYVQEHAPSALEAIGHVGATDQQPEQGGLLVQFNPQAWVNDYAINADPEGQDTWVIGLDELIEGDADFLTHGEVSDSTALRGRNTPDWVDDWSGPFQCRVIREAPYAEAVTFWRKEKSAVSAMILRNSIEDDQPDMDEQEAERLVDEIDGWLASRSSRGVHAQQETATCR